MSRLEGSVGAQTFETFEITAGDRVLGAVDVNSDFVADQTFHFGRIFRSPKTKRPGVFTARKISAQFHDDELLQSTLETPGPRRDVPAIRQEIGNPHVKKIKFLQDHALRDRVRRVRLEEVSHERIFQDFEIFEDFRCLQLEGTVHAFGQNDQSPAIQRNGPEEFQEFFFIFDPTLGFHLFEVRIHVGRMILKLETFGRVHGRQGAETQDLQEVVFSDLLTGQRKRTFVYLGFMSLGHAVL